MRWTVIVSLVVLFVMMVSGTTGVAAQPGVEGPIAMGDAAFNRGAFGEAAELYRAALDEGIDHPFLHFRLGYSLHVTGRVEEALVHHLRGVTINNRAVRVDCIYNAACAHALLGHGEEALRYLQYAIDAGFVDKAQVQRDTDLDALRADERFGRLVAGIGVEPTLFEQLNFMLGEWSLTDEQGRRLVYRLERPVEGSAAITYAVTNHRGLAWGGAMVPNPVDRTWELTYCNAIGTTYRFVGRFEGGVVTFEGGATDVGGAGVPVRVSYRLNEDGGLVESAVECRDGQNWEVHHEVVLGRSGAGS